MRLILHVQTLHQARPGIVLRVLVGAALRLVVVPGEVVLEGPPGAVGAEGWEGDVVEVEGDVEGVVEGAVVVVVVKCFLGLDMASAWVSVSIRLIPAFMDRWTCREGSFSGYHSTLPSLSAKFKLRFTHLSPRLLFALPSPSLVFTPQFTHLPLPLRLSLKQEWDDSILPICSFVRSFHQLRQSIHPPTFPPFSLSTSLPWPTPNSKASTNTGSSPSEPLP